jgi:galactokinase
VVAETRPTTGFTGEVRSDLPLGAGLASSAALEVAVALALGVDGDPVEVALACQRAEQAATGVPCGVMDQLAATAAVAGCALLLDCASLDFTALPLPDGVEVVVVHSGERRSLAVTAYAERRRQCEAAAAEVGPLRSATPDDVEALADPVLRRRARHVVTENARVTAFAAALVAGDLVTAGRTMGDSHASLRDDFEVSTPLLDELVERLTATPGVYGARLTGAGFGGCVVALAAPGSPVQGWRLRAVGGATVEPA